MVATRLRPWERVPVMCERCNKVATSRCVAGSVVTEDLGLVLDESPELGAHLACDDHYDELLHVAFLEGDGVGSGTPLRWTWHQWFRKIIPGWEAASIGLHNWRFERRVQRAMSCDHEIVDGQCTRCTTRWLTRPD